MNKVSFDVFSRPYDDCWIIVFRKNKFDVEFIDEHTYPGAYREFIIDAIWEEENT